MSTASGPAHRSVSNIRPQPTATPASPHTPLRATHSTYGSPSALRAEEDCVIIELGSRYLRAGFSGDSIPKAIVDFGPEEQGRPGDYRRWRGDFEKDWRKRIRGSGWGQDNELWELDLRGVDLGLVGDKIERAVRVAFTKYLLIDSRPRRMALVIPSALPLPLLSTILDSLFTNFQPPSISLLSAPALTTIAAGLRSALVVDIGWAETVVTAIYEYREVQCRRSTRGCKLHGKEMFKMLVEAVNPAVSRETSTAGEFSREARQILSFEECEDITSRVAWCKSTEKEKSEAVPRGLAPVKEEDEFRSSMRSMNPMGSSEGHPSIAIPLSSTAPPRTIRLPFSKLAEPCEKALFASERLAEDFDDEELPLQLLVYRSLLQLPVDIRSMCMPRIVFVGGGSKILGLKARILEELAILIDRLGWNPVRGTAAEQYRANPNLKKRWRHMNDGPNGVLDKSSYDTDDLSTETVNAAFVEQEMDPIEEHLKRESSKGVKPEELGYLRAVDSLGAWSGGSLLSHLKIPAVSVVTQDQWTSHGTSGASRDGEVINNINAKRQSMVAAAFKTGAAERSSWTLGLWG